MVPIKFQMNNGLKSCQKHCSFPFKNRFNKNKLLATQPPFLKTDPWKLAPNKTDGSWQSPFCTKLLLISTEASPRTNKAQPLLESKWLLERPQELQQSLDIQSYRTSGVELFFSAVCFLGGNPVVLYLSGRPWMSRELFLEWSQTKQKQQKSKKLVNFKFPHGRRWCFFKVWKRCSGRNCSISKKG